MKDAKPGSPILLFGVGPTLHHAFLAAETASELHLGDYLLANLCEIERWLAREPAAHDWRPFVRYTLACERGRRSNSVEVAEREDLVRSKVTRLMLVDLRRSDPMLGQAEDAYSTVISAYCADSATADRRTWETYMVRIAELVEPGGLLLVAALRRSCGYRVGTKLFPSANVDEEAMRAVLRPLCEAQSLRVEACQLQEHAGQGYTGILLVRGRRRAA